MTIAVVFPGQGSQTVGMLAELADEYPVVQTTFQAASDVVGKNLWSLVQDGSAEALADTRMTQPVMFASDIAVWRVLEQAGLPAPAVVAGHSLGEFAAMVAAGAMTFADGIQLVKRRAELMAAAVPAGEGGMAALIGMDDEAVVSLCQELTGVRVTEAVNFNAPGQVAISGHIDALERTVTEARDRGVRKAVMLAVSVPNHSSLMRKAGEQLVAAIDAIDWKMPEISLVQNATARAAPDLDTLLSNLRKHVYSPVYWTRSIQALRDDFAVTTVIECGPGKVLSGLGKRIDRQLPTLPVNTPATLQTVLDAVSDTAVS